MKFLAILVMITSPLFVLAQTDTLVLSNGDVIVGEIKDMTRGVLTLETDYSDSDFKIEWEKVRELRSKELYTVNLSDRSIYTNARLTAAEPGYVTIEADEGSRKVNIQYIVYLRELDRSFWSKLNASIDIGYSITKAQNLHQFNADLNIGYKTDRWTLKATSRQVRSSQDSVDPVRRVEAALSGDYMLRNGIFFGSSLNFLSNSEQNLELRTTGNLGIGYYFYRTNALLWNAYMGAAINNEQFERTAENMGEDLRRESYEGVVGTTLDLYDLGDIDLYTNFIWYPSFTERGRNRIDYKIDVKYDLPLDFYIKAGLTLEL